MRAPHRVLGATLMLTACLALAACGDDDSDAGSSASAAHGGLGTVRYERIEAVYVAGSAFEELGDEPSASEYRAATKPYVQACEALDKDDPLLAAQRRGCAVGAKLFRQFATFADCESESSGCGVLEDIPGTLAQLEEAARRADQAARDADLDEACARGLQAKKSDYENLDKLQEGFTLLARALRTSSGADAQKAGKFFEELPDDTAGPQDLKRFRAGCA